MEEIARVLTGQGWRPVGEARTGGPPPTSGPASTWLGGQGPGKGRQRPPDGVSAAAVRTVLRLVDGLFSYLVAFTAASPQTSGNGWAIWLPTHS